MATVYFRGFVLPKFISELEAGPLQWSEPTLGSVSLKFKVRDLIVAAECDIQGDINDDRITHLHIWVFHLIRGYLDAISFAHGTGITFVLNQFYGPDRIEKQLVTKFADLSALCTLTADELFLYTMKERSALKHIHDLADSLVDPLEAFFLCGRSTEGFRRLLLPNGSVARQWEFMREQLNLSEDYLKFITDRSKLPRHGGVDPMSTSDIHEVRKRGWTIANRFLEFRKRGNIKLPSMDFPLL